VVRYYTDTRISVNGAIFPVYEFAHANKSPFVNVIPFDA
jgi:hypothetical protein